MSFRGLTLCTTGWRSITGSINIIIITITNINTNRDNRDNRDNKITSTRLIFKAITTKINHNHNLLDLSPNNNKEIINKTKEDLNQMSKETPTLEIIHKTI